jgi:hypothetical protein
LIRLVQILLRFAVIVIAYAGAAVAASLFLNIVIIGMAEGRPVADAGLALSVAAGALFVGYFAFLPAMVAIVVGEVTGKRDWLFYALGGAASGAVVVTLFWFGEAADTPDPAFALAVIAAGIVGAWVYWLIAGRHAGHWRRRLAPVPSETKES